MSAETLARPFPGHNATLAFDVERVRRDFPILTRQVYGKPLVFLDSGASAQKPRQVLETMDTLLRTSYANVHRGVYRLSQESTDAFEGARAKVARFLNAPSPNEIVFTRSATEAINLVAQTWGRTFLKAGDEIVVSEMEHHANIVPWQLLRAEKGIVLKPSPIDDKGNFLLDEFKKLLTNRTKLVAITHVSNVLGTVTPLAEIVDLAHARGIPVLVDGSQAVPHKKVDVQKLDVDFYVFTGHKLYGPTAIGVLWAEKILLDALPPWQGGGDMIASVTFEETLFKEPPYRFEAGTPPIVEAVGLGAAIDYVTELGQDAIAAHEAGLLAYATERLSEISGLTIHGQAEEKSAILSFTLADIHPHDIGTILDRQGIAVRVGQHCAEPLMKRLGVSATVRASFGLYNTREEVDALVRGLHKVKELFG